MKEHLHNRIGELTSECEDKQQKSFFRVLFYGLLLEAVAQIYCGSSCFKWSD